MAKRVQITLDLSEHFVRMLQAEVGLSGLGPDKDQHTPSQALAVVALAEARGALPEQVHLLTPIEWRPDIQCVSEARRVRETEESPKKSKRGHGQVRYNNEGKTPERSK